jgi:hypothetical protein
MKRLPRTLAAALTASAVLVATPELAEAGSPTPSAAVATAHAARPRLTNLDHLDFLGDTVTPPAQSGHTTYRLSAEPAIGVLWTYADHQADGSYKRVGGGTYDPASDTYGQGAFNADDIARAAVVYLRHWRQTGAASSRRSAYELLRGLTYLQATSKGPRSGNVVLWMQPDGTLHPSADPADTPDPSDSDASYWLARTVWALGEGYAAFRRSDPSFAGFLKQRLDLGVRAIDRQVLDRDRQFLQVDGRRTPAWFIADGADASAEAVLGLAAYVRAGGGPRARHVLTRLSAGIARMSGGDARRWPFGGVLPWALSRSDWHAWASQMPAALAAASTALDRPALADVAARDSFTFDPWLLTSGGPDNGRLPSRVDATQIAYGVDSRVQSLVATGRAGHRRAADRLAGVVAAWFFGANASRKPTYDPATGVTIDGVASDGTVNQNSGAESTIHGLLTMLALDSHPVARRIALTASVQRYVGTDVVEAESGALSGDATVVQPASSWTGESQYSGDRYVSLRDGSRATYALGRHRRALLIPVVDLRHGSTGVTTFRAGRTLLGTVRAGAVAPSGDSGGPGALLPVTLPNPLGSRAGTVTATTAGGETRLDALIVQPLVTRVVLGGRRHGTALLRSAATTTQHVHVRVPGVGNAQVWSYDGRGVLQRHQRVSARSVRVAIVPGGFALVRR